MTWVIGMWPYVEQQPLFDRWDFNQPFHEPPNEPLLNDIEGRGAALSILRCPSHGPPGTLYTFEDQRRWRPRGNYVVNYGNTTFDQRDISDNHLFMGAPFGYNYVQTFSEITDGLSNTLFMSEVLWTARDDRERDQRGDVYNDGHGMHDFTAMNTPNSSAPCRGWCFDVSTPPGPPCETGTDGSAHTTARSEHPGGVNVLLGDSSVRFVSDTINLFVWRAMSTSRGGESLQ